MQIDIQARDYSLTNAMRDHAERRLHLALASSDDSIQRVVMRLSDINGPRGGADQRCHVHVLLGGLPDVVVEDTEEDLYMAIDRAADRAGRAVQRKIGRRQARRRQGYPRLPATPEPAIPDQDRANYGLSDYYGTHAA